MKFAMVFIVLG